MVELLPTFMAAAMPVSLVYVNRRHQPCGVVGRAALRCDLAITDPAGDGYALAILLDNPGDAVADSCERYVFRPAILRSFGWRVLDVPGKDWLSDADAVLARIEGMLATGTDRALAMELAPRVPAQCQEAPPLAAPDTPATQVRSLRFEQGGSRKFWKAGVSGDALRVSYGRIGSVGQTIVKQFESSERTVRELNKLTDEKLRKGYVEA